jgi:hypothetical protein
MNINISVDLSDIDPDAITALIMDEVADELEGVMLDIYTDLTDAPPVGTPVDEGTARNSWQLDTTVPLEPEVYSTNPYIGRLNDGHSKQSPAGFVDAIVDKHTR